MALKKKSKQVLDIIASDPKTTATDAYMAVHTGNRQTARTNAYKLLSKPEAQIYLQQHVNKARNTIVELLGSKKDDIRLRSAQDIIDREYGRAVQRQEVKTTGVTLTLDLTSSLTDD